MGMKGPDSILEEQKMAGIGLARDLSKELGQVSIAKNIKDFAKTSKKSVRRENNYWCNSKGPNYFQEVEMGPKTICFWGSSMLS